MLYFPNTEKTVEHNMVRQAVLCCIQSIPFVPSTSVFSQTISSRAVENNHLLPGSGAPDPGLCSVEAPGSEESFELLRRCCCVAGGPSERPTWALFRTFVRLLAHQLGKVERYPLLGAEVAVDGMETFRCAVRRKEDGQTPRQIPGMHVRMSLAYRQCGVSVWGPIGTTGSRQCIAI